MTNKEFLTFGNTKTWATTDYPLCFAYPPPPFHFEIQILGSKIKWWGPLINNFANIINSCRITEYSIASGSNQVKKMIYIQLSNITAVTLMDEEVIRRFFEIWPGSPWWQQPWCSCSLVHDPRLMNSLRWLIVGFYWLTEVQGVMLLLDWRRFRLWCYGCSLQFLFLASSGHFLLSFNTYLFSELACPVMSWICLWL